MDERIIEQIVQQVVAKLGDNPSPLTENGPIPIAVSARHVHLEKSHVEILFGPGYQLTKKQDLSQPGQFAANETLMVVGPKGSLERVRVLGPTRSKSQVEVSLTDAFKLGSKPPLRESGNTKDSGAITLVGPKGTVYLKEGLIIAQNHIHMKPEDASTLAVQDGDYVRVLANTERPLTFNNVKVRVSEKYCLEMHIDTDEANAAFVGKNEYGTIIRADDVSPTPIASQKTDQIKQPIDKMKTFDFNRRLLTKEIIEKIDAKQINVKKKTIVTALAHDVAREREIKIKIV